MISNPYLEAVESLPVARWPSDLSLDYRSGMVKEYAWAIPNTQAITTIAKYGPIVEMGAGTGYWASLLRQIGTDVLALDKNPPDKGRNEYRHSKTWTDVINGVPASLHFHPDRSLFICWPPYKDPMAEECLKYWKGKTLIYVGEGRGGCTGTDGFHEILEKDFDLAKQLDIPQWEAIHDRLYIYKKKTQ